MSDWRPSFLAATIVLSGGGFIGAVTADQSETGLNTATQGAPERGGSTGEPDGVPGSENPAPTPRTEPTLPPKPKAPAPETDTIMELNAAGDVDGVAVEAEFGTQTIAGETFEGVSMLVNRSDIYDTGSPWIEVTTRGRYTRLSGVVGISENTECENDASVSITDGGGQNLWGPETVSIGSKKEFDVKIKGLIGIRLFGLSRAQSDQSCPANPAWGDIKFVKAKSQ